MTQVLAYSSVFVGCFKLLTRRRLGWFYTTRCCFALVLFGWFCLARFRIAWLFAGFVELFGIAVLDVDVLLDVELKFVLVLVELVLVDESTVLLSQLDSCLDGFDDDGTDSELADGSGKVLDSSIGCAGCSSTGAGLSASGNNDFLVRCFTTLWNSNDTFHGARFYD